MSEQDDRWQGIVVRDEERQPCEVWTRVMGYMRPVDQFNRGKKQEFRDRKYFSQKLAEERIEMEDKR